MMYMTSLLVQCREKKLSDASFSIKVFIFDQQEKFFKSLYFVNEMLKMFGIEKLK